jgi:hypothetical protein
MTPEEFAKLSYVEKRELAISHTTSPEILDMLAKDAKSGPLSYIADNPNTSPETLDFLARGNHEHMRGWITANPKLSQESLNLLIADEKFHVRYMVAKYAKNLTIDQLVQLGQDIHQIVRNAALERL